MGALYTKFSITTSELLRSICFPVSLSLSFLLLIFLLVVSILLFYLWYSAYSQYILDVLYVFYVSVRYSFLDDTECRNPVYCIAHTRSISRVGVQYAGIILPTLLAVYIIYYSLGISHYVVFQGFPHCEVLLVYSILLGEYVAWVCCSISRFDTLDILWVLDIISLQ